MEKRKRYKVRMVRDLPAADFVRNFIASGKAGRIYLHHSYLFFHRHFHGRERPAADL